MVKFIHAIVFVLLTGNTNAQGQTAEEKRYQFINQYLAQFEQYDTKHKKRYFSTTKYPMVHGTLYRKEAITKVLSKHGLDTNEFLTKFAIEDTTEWEINKVISPVSPGPIEWEKTLKERRNPWWPFEGERHIYTQVNHTGYSFSRIVLLDNDNYLLVRTSHWKGGTCLKLYQLKDDTWQKLESVDCYMY